ncbi:hypothetical protein J6TS1_07180 [Siminovitchia terrae]|uniref:GrpB family protein n=2 Tax=Siminovitchia terrae TaxID=1914933 RepID=A0ABQ4KS35_SIMTE|nr:GrpB family protein [Siminovitchia terrae]GIN91236.1 hypothetical protein J22TS1_22870 [Siminovitchia terrae]GIN94848.1 hypothetical protein J6TS1_07180 [Siminovitchia terrae]
MSMQINVVPYQEEWEMLFQKEAESLQKSLGEEIVSVLHIGSTSVKGLKAKPIIDILLVVKKIESLDQYDNLFRSMGYEPRGELGIKGRRYYAKGGYYRTHQIHAFQFDNVYEIQRHLSVRDYLRAHPDIAREYGEIKVNAAQRHPEDIEGYCDEKDGYVQQLEKQALKWTWQQG